MLLHVQCVSLQAPLPPSPALQFSQLSVKQFQRKYGSPQYHAIDNTVHVYGRKGFLYKAILAGTNTKTSHYIPQITTIHVMHYIKETRRFCVPKHKKIQSMWTQQLVSAHFCTVFSWTNSVYLQHFCCKVHSMEKISLVFLISHTQTSRIWANGSLEWQAQCQSE